jgi:hypothetical protein
VVIEKVKTAGYTIEMVEGWSFDFQ